MDGWTTLTLRATTPIFNGGALPELATDNETGVRVASIRGSMRFWFRALAATVTGPDLALLAEVERRVFGGPETASTCVLRIPQTVPLQYRRVPDFLDGEGAQWVSYLLGLGLAEWDPATKGPQLLRPYVAPTSRFKLLLRFNHPRQTGMEERQAIEALAFAALWLTSAYGGIGARTRRGFGGFEIVDAVGDLPAPWTADTFRCPALEHYEKTKNLWPTSEIADAARLLPALIPADRHGAVEPLTSDWKKRPEFPILSRKFTVAGLSRQGTDKLTELLERTGHKLRGFRTSSSHQSPVYRPERGVPTPEWGAMNEDTLRVFPMAALGLPVNYSPKKSTDGPSFVVNLAEGEHRSGGHQPLRQASKLWLRPVFGDTGKKKEWRLFSFGFLHSLPPGSDHHLCLWKNKGAITELTTDSSDAERLIRTWIKSQLPNVDRQ